LGFFFFPDLFIGRGNGKVERIGEKRETMLEITVGFDF
jgi:hypothetical protein